MQTQLHAVTSFHVLVFYKFYLCSNILNSEAAQPKCPDERVAMNGVSLSQVNQLCN